MQISTEGRQSIKRRTQTFFNLVFSQKYNLPSPFQTPDALWRYKKLLSLFNTSLTNIKKSPSNKKNEAMHNLTGMVKKEWHQLLKETRKLVKVKFIL